MHSLAIAVSLRIPTPHPRHPWLFFGVMIPNSFIYIVNIHKLNGMIISFLHQNKRALKSLVVLFYLFVLWFFFHLHYKNLNTKISIRFLVNCRISLTFFMFQSNLFFDWKLFWFCYVFLFQFKFQFYFKILITKHVFSNDILHVYLYFWYNVSHVMSFFSLKCA